MSVGTGWGHVHEIVRAWLLPLIRGPQISICLTLGWWQWAQVRLN